MEISKKGTLIWFTSLNIYPVWNDMIGTWKYHYVWVQCGLCVCFCWCDECIHVKWPAAPCVFGFSQSNLLRVPESPHWPTGLEISNVWDLIQMNTNLFHIPLLTRHFLFSLSFSSRSVILAKAVGKSSVLAELLALLLECLNSWTFCANSPQSLFLSIEKCASAFFVRGVY